MTEREWFVGTSGFMTSRSQWLKLPGLNCIEINSTFYALPTPKIVENWLALPSELFFSIKLSRYITHIKRLKKCAKPWKLFWSKIKPLGDRLKAVLIQLPPSFKNKPETLARVKAMAAYLPKDGPTIAFEFRSTTWFHSDVYRVMRENGWCMVGTLLERETSRPWLGDLPFGLHIPMTTSNATYVRVHGGKGYRGSYSERRLEAIRKDIVDRKTERNFIMFNNVFFERRGKTCKVDTKRIRYAALCNGVEFGELVKKGKNKTRKVNR